MKLQRILIAITALNMGADNIRCIATTRVDVLIGRNVLNRFFITFDGKRQIFTMSE